MDVGCNADLYVANQGRSREAHVGDQHALFASFKFNGNGGLCQVKTCFLFGRLVLTKLSSRT